MDKYGISGEGMQRWRKRLSDKRAEQSQAETKFELALALLLKAEKGKNWRLVGRARSVIASLSYIVRTTHPTPSLLHNNPNVLSARLNLC